jgi:hypothetical protein
MADPTPSPDPTEATPPEPEPPTLPPSDDDDAPPARGGDDSAAFARIKAERDALKAQIAEANAKLADVKTAEDLEAAKLEWKTEQDAMLLDKAIEVELIKAGCVNLKATKALIEREALKLSGDTVEGLDVGGLTKEVPYLFAASSKIATGAPVAGVPTKGEELEARLRKAAGLKTKE